MASRDLMLTDTTKDHFLRPRHVGELDDADGTGTEGRPGAGNFMVISVRLRDDLIEAAAFRTHGCAAAIASGSCLTEWVTGLPVGEALAITPAALSDRLGGLPLGRRHCAGLAVNALRRALAAASKTSP